MITINSNGSAISSEFISAISDTMVSYDMALILNGERLPGTMGRMTLTLGSADDSGDSSADMALGGVFSTMLEGQLIDCAASVIDKELEVRVGVEISEGVYEYVTVAYVTVIWARKADEITSIQAIGRIAAKMTAIPLGLSTGYVSASALASRIAAQSGMAVNIGAFRTKSQQVHVDAGWTCRRALQALALSLGGFAAEINGGVLVAPIPNAYTYDLSGDITRTVPQLADDLYTVDGLTVTTGQGDEESTATEYVYGTGRLVITDEFATKAIADVIWSNVSQISYMAGSVEVGVLDPRLTPFDALLVHSGSDAYCLPATNIVATYDGGYFGTLSANAPSESAGESIESGPMMVAVGEARSASTVASAAAASAKADAETASAAAAQAVTDAGTAQAMAQTATTNASEAKTQAKTATAYALSAGRSLSDVERVVGTLNWISEHGRYVSAAGTQFDSERVYYTRAGEGTDADPYRYSVVAEPVAADIAAYYYLVVDESVQNYVNAHLWVDSNGLNIASENDETGDKAVKTGWRIGSVFEMIRSSVSWVKLWLENNVAKLRIGSELAGHILIDDDSIDVMNGSDTFATFGKNGLQMKPALKAFTNGSVSADITMDHRNSRILHSFNWSNGKKSDCGLFIGTDEGYNEPFVFMRATDPQEEGIATDLTDRHFAVYKVSDRTVLTQALFYLIPNGDMLLAGDIFDMSGNAKYLPLSGGTLTGTVFNQNGGFVARSTNANFDRDGAAHTADLWSSGFYVRDKDGEDVVFLRAVRRKNTGRMDAVIYAYNEPDGGTAAVSNYMIIGILRDGTRYYAVADAAKFRSDLGITPANIGAAASSHNHLAENQWLNLGSAASNTTTTFTLPESSGSFLLATAHNSTAACNSLWLVRPQGNSAFKLSSGGGNVSVTVSGATVKVTMTSGTVIVYAQRL